MGGIICTIFLKRKVTGVTNTPQNTQFQKERQQIAIIRSGEETFEKKNALVIICLYISMEPYFIYSINIATPGWGNVEMKGL